MRTYRLGRLGLVAAVTVIVSASPSFASPSARSGFKAMVLADEPNGVTASLTPACLAPLRAHLRRNRSLESRVLTRFLIPVETIATRAELPGVFYHYTTAWQMKEVARTRDFDAQFAFLRNLRRTDPMRWHIYVAADATSSKDYGPIQVQIRIDPKARLFDPLRETSSALWNMPEEERREAMLLTKIAVTDEVEREILKTYPELGDCVFPEAKRSRQRAEDFSILTLLALEEADVSLISYYGFEHAKAPYWFAVIGASRIVDWTIGSEN